MLKSYLRPINLERISNHSNTQTGKKTAMMSKILQKIIKGTLVSFMEETNISHS